MYSQSRDLGRLGLPPFYKRDKLRLDKVRYFENSSKDVLATLYSKRYKKQPDLKTSFYQNLKEFLTNSSLHGLKYTADGNISIFERIFFVFSFFILLFLSGYFISKVYNKWSSSPIIISRSSDLTYTSTIPFPAITICSVNQAKKSIVKDISKSSLKYSMLRSLCDNNAEKQEKGSRFLWSTFRDFILNVSQTCEEMIVYCRFGNSIEECKDIFNPVLTDDGLCYTFNAVNPKYMYANNRSEENSFNMKNFNDGSVAIDWTPETQYPKILPKKFHPRIAPGTGSQLGLTVVLNTSLDEYYCTTTNSIGFKVLVHNPTEQPKIANYGFLISARRENRVTIIPSLQEASSTLREIGKSTRHCLFANEGNLTFYRTYSRKNCELECESRLMESECDCVLYFMPRPSPNSTICKYTEYKCAKNVLRQIESTSNRTLTCEKCYPACFELSYSQVISTSEIAGANVSTKDDYPDELFSTKSKDMAIVHFFYETNFFRSNKKEELIGFADFLSNIGGLLGLFLGFSVFSLIEIFYFMSLRPYCACKTKKAYKNEIKKERTKLEVLQMKNNIWSADQQISGVFKNSKKFSPKRSSLFKRVNSRISKINPKLPYYD